MPSLLIRRLVTTSAVAALAASPMLVPATASAAPAPTPYADVRTPVKMSAAGDTVYVTTKFRCRAGSTYSLEVIVTQVQSMQNAATRSGTCTGHVQSFSASVAAIPELTSGVWNRNQGTYVVAHLSLDGTLRVTEQEFVSSLKPVK